MGDVRNNRLAELLEPFTEKDRLMESTLKGIRFFRADKHVPRRPVPYEPSIIIIAQGHKIAYIGDKACQYDPCNYLVLSVPLPLDCETYGTPEEPMLGFSISVDFAAVSELLIEMEDRTVPSGPLPRGIYSTRMTEELIDAAIRLLTALRDPLDGAILGPQIVREIIYRVLRGEQGGALMLLATRHSRFGQIAKILKHMHSDFSADIDVETMAGEASMSVSSFHSNFKSVTGVSPLQYLKKIRLHKARAMIVQDGLSVGNAAGSVGYESVSQFSREFKRYFGHNPTEAPGMRSLAELSTPEI